MADLVHAKIKFIEGKAGKNRKLNFLGKLVAESWDRDNIKGVYVDVLEGKVTPCGSRNNPYPYIEKDSVLRFNLVDREDLEALDKDSYEVEIIELTPEEKEIVEEADAKRKKAEETRKQAELVKELTRRLADARREEERALEELADCIRKMTEEKNKKTQFETEQEQLLLDGVESFFTVDAIPQKRGTHYFCVFNDTVSKLCFATFNAYARASNGKYHIDGTRRGFYFKSDKSKDKFFTEVSLDIKEWLKDESKELYSGQMLTEIARNNIKRRAEEGCDKLEETSVKDNIRKALLRFLRD